MDALELVIDAWSESLSIHRSELNVSSDFFMEGGDSLIAVEVAVSLSEKLGVELPLMLSLETPVLGEFADAVRELCR